MRILLIGSDNAWRMEAAVERALRRAGHTTLLIDDRRMKRLIGWRLTQLWARYQAERFEPDFVFLSKCLALDPETVSHIIAGKANAMWYHDPQWYRDLDRPDIGHIAEVGKLSRTFFVTGFEDEWRANGLPAMFLPAAGDAGIKPVAPEERFGSDVAFIGTGYDRERAKRLIAVAAHHDLRVWGPGWEEWRDRLSWSGRSVEGNEFAAVCSSSGITLGINPARAAGGVSYTSDRTWMVMLAGGFHLAERSPGVAAMLCDGEHCAFYDDTESCIAQCSRYLSAPGEREEIRIAGERFVRAHHTYDQRIANILENRPFVNPLATG
ncbi:MAG: glycosyltransferase [Gemmatimonadaceae bacterium]|nr:glycosyltransferase [Gemmatimonadaceae bacterium]